MALLAAAVLLAGCDGTPSAWQTGDAFQQGNGTISGIAPFRPGSRVGMLELYLHNVSSQPLTLQSVQVTGPGVGSVVRVEKMAANPELPGIHALPGGLYTTEPPVWFQNGVCYSAILKPLAGFMVPPGAEARVWIVFESLAPGSFSVPSQPVFYTQGGVRYRQVIPLGYKGGVAVGSKFPKPDRTERPCLTGTNSLN